MITGTTSMKSLMEIRAFLREEQNWQLLCKLRRSLGEIISQVMGQDRRNPVLLLILLMDE